MRFLNVMLTSSLGLSLLYCGQGVATPLAYSNPKSEQKINNRTTSTLLADSESERIVWVLPPTGGVVEPKGFMPSANLGFCPGVKELQNASFSIVKRISENCDNFNRLKNEATEERKKIDDVELKLSNLPKIVDIVEQVNRNDEAVMRLLTEISKVRNDSKKSQEDINKEVQKKNDEIETLENETRKLLVQKRQVNQLESFKSSIKESYNLLKKQEEDLLDRIEKLKDIVDNMYKDRVKLEGGHIFVDYDLKWEENLQKLRRDNPHYDFKQIPTRNARIFANFISPEDKDVYFSTLPLLIDYSVAGIKYASWGKIDESNGNIYSLPNIINGNFRINLLGACPIHDKNFFASNPENAVLTSSAGYPVFGIHTTFDYPIIYKFKVHAEYNLYRVYEEIKKKAERGGFFSKKSYAELIQNKNDSDSMKITIDDEGTGMSKKTRFEMLEKIKTDIINKALSGMAEPVSGAVQNSSLELPQGKDGAQIMADGIQYHFGIYGWAAGWILRGADSIWGSREAETRFKNEYNKKVTYDWSITNPAYRAASTGFKREKTI